VGNDALGTDIDVVVDVSQAMIDYANAKARVQALENASFQVIIY
jgi:hypothetical protein